MGSRINDIWPEERSSRLMRYVTEHPEHFRKQ